MAYSESVEQLGMMGFEAHVAQYALGKVSGDVPRAIEWLFTEEGRNFVENPVIPSEGDHRPPDPTLEAALRSSAAQVVAPPTYDTGVRNITGFSNHDGATVSHNEVVDLTDDKGQDEDKEMEAAIAMSLGREGAPPPPTYGPSTKVEDGSTALVPAGQDASATAQADSDADLDRAIQDSLMTASFHSMSAMPSEAPSNHEREANTPIVLRAADPGSTYAAYVLQALYAVPHFRDVIRLLPLAEDSDTGIKALQELVVEADASKMAYQEAGIAISAVRNGYEPYQLPPVPPTRVVWEGLVGLWQSSNTPNVAERIQSIDLSTAPVAAQRRLANPSKLFSTKIDSSQQTPPTYVNIQRDSEGCCNIAAGLAKIMWIDGQGMESIVDLGDILAFMVENTGSRVPWQMEEVIYMDRFMKDNRARSAQLRAEQSLAVGNLRRLKDKLQSMTVHKDQKILDSLQRAIKHYEDSPEVDDVIYKETAREMQLKLQEVYNTLKSKVDELQSELAAEETKAAGSLFETSDPAYLKHGYRLYAALWHDGFPSGLNHLYAYIRTDDGEWWKVTEHETTKTDFATMSTDRVGLYTDGGPYMLLYAREGEGPPTPIASPKVAPVEMNETRDAPGPVEDIEMADAEQSIQVVPASSEEAEGVIEQGIS